MKYFKTIHQRNSARITTLIVLILLLLLFVVGPPYMDPPLEYGVAVNFGTSDVGSGDVQPLEPIRSEPNPTVENTTSESVQTEESQPAATPADKVAEQVMTADNEEAIAIKNQKKAAEIKAKQEADQKAEADRVIKEKQAAVEKKRQEEAEKKKNLDALIGGVKSSDGKAQGGEGNDNKPGDKGQRDGDPYAASYFGTPGAGSGGSNYGLKGRGRPTNSKVLPDCNEEGRVVVEIHVNRDGKVIKAIAGGQGTTGVSCLFSAAEKTAMTYKWPSDPKAPVNQVGYVIIDFSLTQ